MKLITSYCDGNVRAVGENGPLPSVEAVDSLAWFSAWSSACNESLSKLENAAEAAYMNLDLNLMMQLKLHT